MDLDSSLKAKRVYCIGQLTYPDIVGNTQPLSSIVCSKYYELGREGTSFWHILPAFATAPNNNCYSLLSIVPFELLKCNIVICSNAYSSLLVIAKGYLRCLGLVVVSFHLAMFQSHSSCFGVYTTHLSGRII